MRLLAALLLTAPPALAGPPPSVPPAAAGATAPGARSLREADRALARAVAARDRAAFAALVAEDAVFGGASRLHDGRDAINGAWGSYFEPDGPRLSWAPDLSEISRSGDLGYTSGRWTYQGRGRDGRTVSRAGRYVTVWRRDPDGAFRALADMQLLPPGGARARGLARRALRAVVSGAGDLEAAAGTWTAGQARSGSYLTVRRRRADGVFVTALETVVPFDAAGQAAPGTEAP